MSSSDPLADIDSVNWSSLTHAYGEASDVPGLLHKLRSPERDDRDRAYWALYSNIYHQGTRYQASSAAVPFLYRLLEDPETPQREEVLGLLVDLASGLPYPEAPLGVSLARWYKRVSKPNDPTWAAKEMQRWPGWVAEASEEEEEEDRRVGIEAYTPLEENGHSFVEYLCYQSVQDGLDSIIRCLSDDSVAVRAWAAYAVAWFPDAMPKIFQALFALLDREKETVVRATALISLSVIQTMAEDFSETEVIRRLRAAYSEDSAIDFIQWASSLALVKLRANTPEQLDWVIRTLADDAYLAEHASPRDGVRFPYSNTAISSLSSLSSLEMEHIKGSECPELTRALIQRIPTATLMQVSRFAGMALHSAFDGVKPDRVEDFQDLTPLQRELLTSLTGVRSNSFLLGSFTHTLREWNLPVEQAALQRLVEGSPEFQSKL